MDDVTVARVTYWACVSHQSGVLDVVNQVQLGEPYNYRPGEIPPPEAWFPGLVDRSDVTLVAYDPAGRPVGYCVALALTRYPDALAVAEELGVQPSETSYLAELGVCVTARRRGIASLLLDRMLADPPAGITAWAVRTLKINAAAIILYQHHGFTLVPGVTEMRHRRPRIYLVRPEP